MRLIGSYIGILPMLAVGIYMALTAFKKIDLSKGKPKHKEKMDQWYKQFGKMMKILSICLILISLFRLNSR